VGLDVVFFLVFLVGFMVFRDLAEGFVGLGVFGGVVMRFWAGGLIL